MNTNYVLYLKGHFRTESEM